eukprot:10320532-Alexandrium_andersonii.AAC.1
MPIEVPVHAARSSRMRSVLRPLGAAEGGATERGAVCHLWFGTRPAYLKDPPRIRWGGPSQ